MNSSVLATVREIAGRVAAGQGVSVYHVEFSSRTLRVHIECEAGTSLEACSRFSRELSTQLDLSDAVPGRYFLEVSSPGIERRLFEPRDYARALNRCLRVRGREGFREGLLAAAGEDGIDLVVTERGETRTEHLRYDDIREARIAVPSSELFAEKSAAPAAAQIPADRRKGTDE